MPRKQMICATCWFGTNQPARSDDDGWEAADEQHMQHDGAHYASWHDEETEEPVGPPRPR